MREIQSTSRKGYAIRTWGKAADFSSFESYARKTEHFILIFFDLIENQKCDH